jgi:hypothetical protein
MDWGSTLVGLAGVGISGFVAYLSLKSRSSPFQQALYSRQIDAYAEVHQALAAWYLAGLEFITRCGCKMDDITRPQLRSNTSQRGVEFFRAHQKWIILLPKEVDDALNDYVATFNALSAPAEVAHQYKKEIVESSDPSALLARAYMRVVEAARKGHGTEPLSRETLNLIREIRVG